MSSVPEYRTNNFNVLLTSLALVGPSILVLSLYFPTQIKSHKYFLYFLAFTTLPLTIWFNYRSGIPEAFLKNAFMVMTNFALTGLLGVAIMVRSIIKATDPLIRQRGKIVIYGFVIASFASAIIISGLFLANLYNIYTLYFINASMALIPLSIGYAIIKHNIFDVDEMFRRTLTYLLATGILVAGFFGLVTVSSLAISGQSSQFVTVIYTLLMVIIFRPLRDRIGRIIDRRFYREKYEYKATIRKASEVLVSIIDLDQLLNKLLDTVVDSIKIERGVILLREGDPERFEAAVSRGYEDSISFEQIAPDHPVVSHLESDNRAVQVNDVRELDRYRDVRESMLALMDEFGLILMFPILFEKSLIGIFGLGEKKSGAWYSNEDIDLLQTLMMQTAVSIENASKVEELKKMVELETSYRELKKLDGLKDHFLSMVSHDLRTPMTSIQGYASILIEKKDKLAEERKERYLNIIIKESKRLTRLISNLLDLQRLNAGKMTLNFEAPNIIGLVDESIESFRGAAMGENLSIENELPDRKVVLNADRDRMSQVIANLLSNAIKFTPDGGRVTVSAEVLNNIGKPEVKILISDTGPGIPLEYQKGLFDKFQQVRQEERQKEAGSGLGLALVKEIIEQHGGKVGVDSEVGKGSAFYFIMDVKEL